MRDFGSPLFSLLGDSGQRRDATCGRGGATHATPPFLEILPRLSPLPPSRILLLRATWARDKVSKF